MNKIEKLILPLMTNESGKWEMKPAVELSLFITSLGAAILVINRIS